jgi:hypothetical protein
MHREFSDSKDQITGNRYKMNKEKKLLRWAILSIMAVYMPAKAQNKLVVNAGQDGASICQLALDTSGKNTYEMMPLGNGEVAANAWIDETGTLLKFYNNNNNKF